MYPHGACLTEIFQRRVCWMAAFTAMGEGSAVREASVPSIRSSHSWLMLMSNLTLKRIDVHTRDAQAVLLIRDPYDSIWSEYQRRSSKSHVAGIMQTYSQTRCGRSCTRRASYVNCLRNTMLTSKYHTTGIRRDKLDMVEWLANAANLANRYEEMWSKQVSNDHSTST